MFERFSKSKYWRNPRNRIVTIVSTAVVLVAALVSSAWFTFHDPAASGQTLWICENGHKFNISAREWEAFQAKHYGEQVKCPECGAVAFRAVKCPHCGNDVPGTGRYCPICKQPLSGG